METLLADRGVTSVTLETGSASTGNIALYQSLGYTTTGERSEDRFDVVEMAKQLPATPATPAIRA